MEYKTKHSDFFEKIGFEKECEWMIHNESFYNFLSNLSEIITDENILTDQEIMECYELKHKELYLEADALEIKLSEIEPEYPGLFNFTEISEDIEILKIENEDLKQIRNGYSGLLNQSGKILSRINGEITDLEFSIADFENREKIVYLKCIDEAKELQDLQKQNKMLCNELQQCYVKLYDPPLFIHQMAFDEYFIKNDLFLCNLNKFINENFKFENDTDNKVEDEVQEKNLLRLEKCRKGLLKFETELIEETMANAEIKTVYEGMNIDIVEANSLEELEEKSRELHIVNLYYETDILMDELKRLINKLVEQKIEIILYENTKEKCERAIKRLNNLKNLSKIVSDALINAEIIWVLMQIDLEKLKNRFNNTERLNKENCKCIKYIEKMLQIQQSNFSQSVFGDSMEKILKIIVEYLKETSSKQEQQKCFSSSLSLPLSLNQFIQGYNRISKSIQSGYNLIKRKKSYIQILNIIYTLDDKNKSLSELLFDGPTSIPSFEGFEFLERIYCIKNDEINISDKIRKLRSKYEEHVKKMENDRLWKYHQLLWIWFLTEPKKLIAAIEDTRRIASKIPSVNVNPLSGIRRKS